MTRTLTLTTYALAFYLGATVALLVPFASPAYPPLAALARLLAEVVR
ncbi:MAG TPA: hypothetical protein VGS01_09665 [Candidatus Limnocylindria bacterium]|jgi:hypothetical protein|nr:hypothetical protein [Candidatus Limnocylindria bacterium]